MYVKTEEYFVYAGLILFVFGIVFGLSRIGRFTDINDKKMLYQHYMLPVVGLLFFVLTPGVLVSLPPKGSKLVVAATHAVVFALAFHLTHKLVWNYFYGREGFNSPVAVQSNPYVNDPCLCTNANRPAGCPKCK